MTILSRIGFNQTKKIPLFAQHTFNPGFCKNIQTINKRFFSKDSHERISRLIGPAPSQPPLPGEPGDNQLFKNLEFAYKYNRHTVLSTEDFNKFSQLSRKDISFFIDLFKEIKQTNNEIHRMNANFERLLNILEKRI